MSTQRTVFDTGPIVAALDRADRYHDACLELIATTPGVLLLPVPVIVEAAQLAHKRLGVAAEAALTESIAREQQFTITCPTEEELARAAVVMRQYADLRLGLVDATVIALAERVGATRSLADSYGRLRSSTDTTGRCHASGRHLHRSGIGCTVEAGAEQTLPKVPG